MKKKYYYGFLLLFMMVLGTLSMASCGDDNDDENGGKEEQAPWIEGTVRGYLFDWGLTFTLYHSIGLGDLGSAIGFQLKQMPVAEFFKDNSVLYYELQDTENVTKISEFMQKNQGHVDPVYEGSWTVWEKHPEWSYFNGTINYKSGTVYERQSPKKFTYTVNMEDNSLTVKDADGKLWEWGILYINFNPSKTVWSELRNAEGELIFHIWNTAEPLDNSKFDKTNP